MTNYNDLPFHAIHVTPVAGLVEVQENDILNQAFIEEEDIEIIVTVPILELPAVPFQDWNLVAELEEVVVHELPPSLPQIINIVGDIEPIDVVVDDTESFWFVEQS